MVDLAPSRHVRAVAAHLPAPGQYTMGARGLEPMPSSGWDHGGGEGEVQLREYWRVLFKYRSVVAASILLGTILAIVFAFTATPRYTAQAKIRISTYEPILSATKIEDMLQQKSRETNYLDTQIEEIRSFSLADRVLEDPVVNQALKEQNKKSWFRSLFGSTKVRDVSGDFVGGYKASVTELRQYIDLIDVRPLRRTSLVLIEATTEKPSLAAHIANAHALAYINWVRSTRVEQQSSGLKFLRAQADELREKVVDLEREIADYSEANSIIAVNKDENIIAQKLSQLNKLLTDATARRIEAEHAAREAETTIGSNNAGYDDDSTQTLRSELAKLEGEYSQLRAKFTDNYPKMGQLKAQIQELRRSIEGHRRQIVSGMKAKAVAAAEEEKNLKEELEQQKSRAFELSKKQVQHNVLNRELTSTRELLENVTRQIKETSLAVESNASNVSMVDKPTVPQTPSYPRKSFSVIVGALAGMVIGVILAFLLSYLDNTVRTPEEITQLLGLPSLGVVPTFDGVGALGVTTVEPKGGEPSGDRSTVAEGAEIRLPVPQPESGSDLPVVFVQFPKSLASEAYRTIRTGILLSQAGEPPRTILVSSAQSSEGKTTSSINLAASLASSGGRVVLIDADLRRPAIHRHLKLASNLPGLVDVLTGQRTVEEVAIPDVVQRVSFIPSGRIPPNPAELLGSLEMATLIDQLSAKFDYVLIDSPPVLPVTDSVILSRYVDGVVLVVKGGSTPKKVVLDAKNRLQSVGARFLGTVLNNVDVKGGDYHYYSRYYSAYYQEEVDAGRSSANS